MSTDKKFQIPFSPPDIGEAEIAEVIDTLRSGWITTGPKTKLLEKRVADWLGAGFTQKGNPRCVCLNSQTACQEMALRLMGIGSSSGGGSEDEVIVPAYTYTASASVVCHVGAKLVFADIQADSLEMDYNSFAQLITANTKAIIPVDIGGIPCDYDKIYSIAESKKDIFVPRGKMQSGLGRIAVLSDSAHAFGASIKGRMIGNIADFSSFSWHAVKNFTTGEGGCLTWKHINGIDDDELYHTLQLLSLHGQSKDAYSKSLLGAWEYDIVAPWYKCNMTDIMAAIGLAQLQRYPELLKKRKQIIERYDAALKPLGVKVLTHYTDIYSSSGHLYITNIPGIDDWQRRKIITQMAHAGVACNVHYKPLPMHTAYKNLGFDIADFPNSYNSYKNEITLPLYTRLSEEEHEYIIKCFTEIIKGCKR